MVPPRLKIGSRGSRLARAQTEEAIGLLRDALPPSTDFETVWLETPGDRDRTTPLTSASVPDDYFTRDLDEALLRGDIDLAVHSAKDLPDPLPDGLEVAALFPAREIRDAIVWRAGIDTGRARLVIGASSERRIEAVCRLYPDAIVRNIRGDVQARLGQLDRGEFDGILVAACALERLGLVERIGEYLPDDPAPQQGRLAIVARAADRDLIDSLRRLDVRRRAGLVALVGCPADAALLSARGRTYLEQADVVLHDRLLPDEVLLQIQDKAVVVGKAGGQRPLPQSEINRRLLMEVEQGKLVVRLQGGDPGMFGHLGEELEFLTAWNIRVDIVPALTAAQVMAARAYAPLTHRRHGRSITFMSGHQATDAPPMSWPGPETGHLALYMPVANRQAIQEGLLEAGWPVDAPVLVGERLGYKDEGFSQLRLADLSRHDMAGPAVLLVGTHPIRPSPATLFVGTNPEHFLRHGPLIHWPLIKLVPAPIEQRVAAVATELDRIQGVLFPSRFSVPCFMEALFAQGLDARVLSGKRLLAVGPATEEELKSAGLRADRAAATLGGVRDLVTHLTHDDRGRYLYPCSDAAPVEQRASFFREHGIDLAASVFYRNRAMPFKSLPRRPFSRVLFTSASTVRVYFESNPEEKQSGREWIAVGPSTLKAIEELGLSGELLDG